MLFEDSPDGQKSFPRNVERRLKGMRSMGNFSRERSRLGIHVSGIVQVELQLRNERNDDSLLLAK